MMDELRFLVMLADAQATLQLARYDLPVRTLPMHGWDGAKQAQIVRWVR